MVILLAIRKNNMSEEICPSYPGQKGSGPITQDGMSFAGSEQQANKGGHGKSVKEEDKDE